MLKAKLERGKMGEEFREKTRKELEKEGLETVRLKLANNEYSGGVLIPIIQAWIKNKELEPVKNANKIASWAIIVSVISFLISLLVAVFK